VKKKYTFLIIPDDDSSSKSYSFNKSSINFLIILFTVSFVLLFFIAILNFSKIFKYDELNNKYQKLAQERLKVIKLSNDLEKIKQMDNFVRQSLGVDLNLEKNKIQGDSLTIIDNNNQKMISLIDNIPSIAPINGFISQRMGESLIFSNNRHSGIDIVSKEGEPIKASASGVVVFSGWTYEMGNLIIIYHGDGYFTHYGHNQSNLKSQLDLVMMGEVIAFVGNTGISSGPHLHFEIWKDNQSIDPLIYFPEYEKNDLTSKNG